MTENFPTMLEVRSNNDRVAAKLSRSSSRLLLAGALALALAAGLVGCASRSSCPSGGLRAPVELPTFVVIRSDQSFSSAIAFLGPDGAITNADWVDTGSVVASLTTGITGDAVLPTSPLGQGAIAWIDRYPIDIVTVVTGESVTVFDARGESEGSRAGLAANPYDLIRLDDTRLLVARFGVNLNSNAPELQRGNDLVVIEQSGTYGRVTRRVALGADVVLSACDTDCVAYARPGILLPLAAGAIRRIVVVLERLSLTFRHAARGAVIALDETSLEQGPPLDLGELVNCQAASVDPMDASHAFVLCTGVPFASNPERALGAGIAEIALSADGELQLIRVVQPSEDGAVLAGGLIALGGERVLAVANDSADITTPDRLWELDVQAATWREVLRSQRGYTLGSGTVRGTLALVPDAESNSVLRIDVAGPATLVDRLEFDDCVGLPPRQVRLVQ